MNVLFVCTGNTCRSPLAVALGGRFLDQRGVEGFELASAGTDACPGAPATREAVATARMRGAALEGHRARRLDRELLQWADVVVPLTGRHVSQIKASGGDIQTVSLAGGDVPDPIGQGDEAYDRCAEQIQQALPALFEELAGDVA